MTRPPRPRPPSEEIPDTDRVPTTASILSDLAAVGREARIDVIRNWPAERGDVVPLVWVPRGQA